MSKKDIRSVIFLFVAMLASSLVIGSYCQTKFKPVELTQKKAPQEIPEKKQRKNIPEY